MAMLSSSLQKRKDELMKTLANDVAHAFMVLDLYKNVMEMDQEEGQEVGRFASHGKSVRVTAVINENSRPPQDSVERLYQLDAMLRRAEDIVWYPKLAAASASVKEVEHLKVMLQNNRLIDQYEQKERNWAEELEHARRQLQELHEEVKGLKGEDVAAKAAHRKLHTQFKALQQTNEELHSQLEEVTKMMKHKDSVVTDGAAKMAALKKKNKELLDLVEQKDQQLKEKQDGIRHALGEFLRLVHYLRHEHPEVQIPSVFTAILRNVKIS